MYALYGDRRVSGQQVRKTLPNVRADEDLALRLMPRMHHVLSQTNVVLTAYPPGQLRLVGYN